MDERYGQLIERQPVAFAFGAPGWYVLGILLLLLMAGMIWLVTRWRRKNRYRWQAVAELARFGVGASAVYPANMLLKRIAMTRYGRADTAWLRGTAWTDFLNSTRGTKLFDCADVELLEQLYDGGSGDPDAFIRKSKEWIRKHKHAL